MKESNTIQTKEPLLNNVNTVKKGEQPELRSINSKKDDSHVDVPSTSKQMTDEELVRKRDQVIAAFRKKGLRNIQPSVIDEEDDPYWSPRP